MIELETLQVSVLGSISVENGTEVSVGGAAPRRILAMLVVAGGETVTVDQLSEATWAGALDTPRAERNLHTYVSRLRARLSDGNEEIIATRPRGYSLRLPKDQVDAYRFDVLVGSGLRNADDGQWETAVEEFERAEGLWADPPYGQFADEPWARPEVERLRELHRRSVEVHAESLIRLERPADAIAVIELILEADPYRETPRRVHMVGLHHAGRTVEALRSFQEYRTLLTEQTGLEVSLELRDLDQRIAAGEEPRVPEKLDGRVRGYEIHERIGSGAFADVFRGTQPGLDRPVAVKAIRKEFANLPDFIRAFETEANTIARLEHPYIVPLYDFWREPDKAYLVMRWLHGGTVEQSLDRGPWEQQAVVRLVVQIGAALATAHRAGVVHRDVKPANILLDDQGNAFLSDFGIALEATQVAEPGAALSLSSHAYSPPEQLLRMPISAQSDQFSLAITVFEMLTGRFPFIEASSDQELLDAQLHSELPSVGDSTPHPAAIDVVLRRATAKSPDDRHRDVEAFVEAFCEAAQLSDTTSQGSDRERVNVLLDLDNPYLGLRPFDEHNHAVFHGRDRLIGQLLDGLADDTSVLAVVGASGSGKSSVVRAGLLPALRSGAVPGSDAWFITTMTPGRHPFESLESALLRVAVDPPAELLALLTSGERGIIRASRRVTRDNEETVLLVIDQFEELFTLCEDDETRRLFLDGLRHALTDPSSPLRVVLTLRADFYDHPLRYPGFAELIRDHGVTVTPLAPDELELAVVTPAAQVGVHFEQGLVAEIVAGVASQPGALPLLQYALTELFEHRSGSVLTIDSYRDLGGIEGALARRAESIFEEADEETQQAIETLFTRLVSLGEGTEDTRRRILRTELRADPAIDAAIDRYVAARLVTVDRDLATRGHALEVAHEALIREWPRLRRWLDDNRDVLRRHRRLSGASAIWESGGRRAEDLYRGARLEAVHSWLDEGPPLNSVEQEFIEAGIEERDLADAVELERRTQTELQNRRLRRLLSAVGLVALLALVAGLLALQQKQRADEEAVSAVEAATLSESRRLAADAAQLVGSNRRVALLLAAEAHRRSPGVESLGALQQALVGSGELLGYLGGGTIYDAVDWVTGSTIAASHPNAVELWSVEDGLIERLEVRGIEGLASSPDGRWIAGARNSDVVVWPADNWTSEAVRTVGSGEFQTVAFSPDGSFLAAARRDGVVDIFDGRTLLPVDSINAHTELTEDDLQLGDAVALIGQHTPAIVNRGATALAFSSDGTRLATGGWGYSRLWSTDDWSSLGESPIVRESGTARLVDSVDAIGFQSTSGGEALVSAGRFVTVMSDPFTGKIRTSSTAELRESAASVNFTELSTAAIGPHQLMTAISGRAIEWTGPDGILREIEPHVSQTRALALHPDESELVVASNDGIVVLSLTGNGLIRRDVTNISGAQLGVSNDATMVVASSQLTGGEQQLVRIEVDQVVDIPLPGGSADLVYSVFGPDDQVVLYNCSPHCEDADQQATFTIFDPRSGEVILTLPAPNRPGVVAISDSGRLFAFSQQDSSITVVEMATGNVRLQFDQLVAIDATDGIQSLNFDATGNLLAASTGAGAAAIFDLQSGTARMLSQGGGSIVQLNFGPEDGQITTASRSGQLTVRDLSDLQPTGRSFIGPVTSAGGPFGPTFTPDGRFMLVTSGSVAQLVDLATATFVGTPLPALESTPATPSRGGDWVVTSQADRVVLFDLHTDEWPNIACNAAGRNFTQAEWDQFGPSGQPYATTCPQYPSLGTEPQGE